MFEASERFALFDHLRVPYAQSDSGLDGLPVRAVWPSGAGEPKIFWAPSNASDSRRPSGEWHLGPARIFGSLVTDAHAERWLDRIGGSWRRGEAIRDAQGAGIASIWEEEHGSAFLPFDPNEVIQNYWSERYLDLSEPTFKRRLRSFARHSYYQVRPALPRAAQMHARRAFARVQAKGRFPRWPIETAFNDLCRLLLDLLTRIAPAPIPTIAPWPRGSSWALVLTHDVEGRLGYRNLPQLLQAEVDRGYRSSWNFVPRNGYEVEGSLLEGLRAQGCEVGVHGLYHDGRDLDPGVFHERLPHMRAYADRWEARGFRSPATLRSWDLIPRLGFEFDSSYSDTAPFEPQAGGCCTWLPYMIADVVELPITLPQDHTVFEILRKRDERLWLDKATFLREQGGMALMLTHPDYIGNAALLTAYERFLEAFAADETAWKAVPGQVSAWWRRRGASELRHIGGSWCVVGPAAGEAAIAFVT